jgi:N-acetylglucosaminyl-diphospho-decaprenol L-rhamnosyltransferase
VTPAISVIVLNYNGRQWLEPCLAALAAQADAPDFETLLVDNGSTDGSIGFVAARFPSVRIVDNGRNLGFAGGNNAGARAAVGDTLVFLNNDTIPAVDWLARLHAASIAAPDRDLVTSRIVFLDRPDIVDSAGDGYLRAGGAFKHGHGAYVAGFMSSREVFGACGAAFLIRRGVFERLNGFDEDFFMVYEDVDLSYRARLDGYLCWYAADAVVRHAGSGTLGVMSATAVFHGQRNLEWTWFKNTPPGLLLRTFPSHVIYSLAGVAHYAARGLAGPALRGKLSALVGLPRLLAKRRVAQHERRIDSTSLERHLERGWMALKRADKARSREVR